MARKWHYNGEMKANKPSEADAVAFAEFLQSGLAERGKPLVQVWFGSDEGQPALGPEGTGRDIDHCLWGGGCKLGGVRKLREINFSGTGLKNFPISRRFFAVLHTLYN